MEKLSEILGKFDRKEVKAPAHYFQDRALKVVEAFKIKPDDKQRKGIVMWAFRNRPEKAEAAFRNMVGKKYKDPAMYFKKLLHL